LGNSSSGNFSGQRVQIAWSDEQGAARVVGSDFLPVGKFYRNPGQETAGGVQYSKGSRRAGNRLLRKDNRARGGILRLRNLLAPCHCRGACQQKDASQTPARLVATDPRGKHGSDSTAPGAGLCTGNHTENQKIARAFRTDSSGEIFRGNGCGHPGAAAEKFIRTFSRDEKSLHPGKSETIRGRVPCRERTSRECRGRSRGE